MNAKILQHCYSVSLCILYTCSTIDARTAQATPAHATDNINSASISPTDARLKERAFAGMRGGKNYHHIDMATSRPPFYFIFSLFLLPFSSSLSFLLRRDTSTHDAPPIRQRTELRTSQGW